MGDDTLYKARQHRVQLASSDGQGSGTVNMNVDGSTPVAFTVQVPTGKDHYWVDRVMWQVADTGAFAADKFGALAELSNGVSMTATTNNVAVDFFGGFPLMKNADFAKFAFDSAVQSIGSGVSFMSSRYTFSKFGGPIHLQPGDAITVTVSDDLQGLDEFFATFQGMVNAD